MIASATTSILANQCVHYYSVAFELLPSDELASTLLLLRCWPRNVMTCQQLALGAGRVSRQPHRLLQHQDPHRFDVCSLLDSFAFNIGDGSVYF